MATNRNAASTAIGRGERYAKNIHGNGTSEPVERLLARLEGVRRCGRGWTARCPCHQDRTASLSVTAGDDGRALVHCFAGCGAADVIAAAGLSMADLFVRRPTSDLTFVERAALREAGRQAQWRAALNVMGFEAKILEVAARSVLSCQKLYAEDLERLQEARQRIDSAREILCA